MSPQAATTQKKERKARKIVSLSDELDSRLTKLGQITAQKVKEAGGPAVKLSHAQLIEAMVDAALENAEAEAPAAA